MVQGNIIGADVTGTNALGNGFANIALTARRDGNFIGGPARARATPSPSAGRRRAPAEPNTTNNAIRGNSIFSNGALGIDLNNDGVTPNHTGFLAGPNDLQNYPVITNAFGYAARTIVPGNLNSLANRSFYIDVYRNPVADPSGYGEGQFYVGTVSVTTDGSGNAAFAFTNTAGNYAGQYFTATATSSGGDTSEFGADVLATNVPAPSAQFSGPFVGRTNGFSFTLTFRPISAIASRPPRIWEPIPIPWVDLTNFTPTNPSLIFTDRTATNFRARFYRAISP